MYIKIIIMIVIRILLIAPTQAGRLEQHVSTVDGKYSFRSASGEICKTMDDTEKELVVRRLLRAVKNHTPLAKSGFGKYTCSS